MKQYQALLQRNFAAVSGTALLSVLTSLAMVFAGYSLSFLFTAYEYGGDRIKNLLYTFLLVLSIWLFAMLICHAAQLAKAGLEQRIKNELRRMVGDKIASLRYSEFTEKDSGHYVSWLTNDVDEIYEQSFAALLSGVENLSAAVFSLGALCLLSPYIALAAVILLAVISVLPQLTNRRLQRANAERSAAMEVSIEGYRDVVTGCPIFFLSRLRAQISLRIAAVSERAEQVCCRYHKTAAAVSTLIAAASMTGQIVLLLVTLLTAAAGTTPAGAALSVGNLAGSFFNGAGELVQHFMTVRASRPLWKKFEIENTDSDTDRSAVDAIPEIRLENVSLRYGSRLALENRSCVFRSGGRYAITGESGSGKTTLAKIILGLLPQYTGNVWYGAREQRSVDPESLYDHIAYVDQQVYLFQDTVRFNITLGRSCTDEKLAEVLRLCRLEEYIRSLPDGLDSVILENGKNLSGGQRQRIALARGLIRDVQYVILDEGTSALDEANALDIESGLLAAPELSVIIITHNLRATIREQLTAVYPVEACRHEGHYDETEHKYGNSQAGTGDIQGPEIHRPLPDKRLL